MIGPAENAGESPVALERPQAAAPKYIGVLKASSPLVRILGGRCVPLRNASPSIIGAGGRFVKAVMLTLEDLQPAHRAGLLGWIAGVGKLFGDGPGVQAKALNNILETGVCPVSLRHFSGVVEAQPKDPE